MVRTETEIKQIVKQYVDYLSKDIEVKKVILYGSYAKGTATEESDIDIAIESPDFTDDFLFECTRLNKSVWRSGVDLHLEPKPLHPAFQEFFVEEIMNTGKVIYEANNEHIPYDDESITNEDLEAIKEAELEYKQSRTKNLEDIKKELQN